MSKKNAAPVLVKAVNGVTLSKGKTATVLCEVEVLPKLPSNWREEPIVLRTLEFAGYQELDNGSFEYVFIGEEDGQLLEAAVPGHLLEKTVWKDAKAAAAELKDAKHYLVFTYAKEEAEEVKAKVAFFGNSAAHRLEVVDKADIGTLRLLADAFGEKKALRGLDLEKAKKKIVEVFDSTSNKARKEIYAAAATRLSELEVILSKPYVEKAEKAPAKKVETKPAPTKKTAAKKTAAKKTAAEATA